ncbi:MAG: hypothetical protein KAS97_07900, partial [Candidatus Aminicenantes bacterium]|nr:hypothetical protein [Candidatus Aminicenantes bacterium]
MMFNVKKILLLVSLFFLLYLQINSRVIKGVVRDIGFRSVENVAIHIKETGKYTISMSDGYFELNVPDG